MKKPKFHKKSRILTFFTIIFGVLAAGGFAYEEVNDFSSETFWIILLVLIVLMMIFMFSSMIVDGKESQIESQWYWENYKDHVAKTKINYVDKRKPTVADLENCKAGVKYQFVVSYDFDIKWRMTEVDGSDPDIQLLIDKITNFKLSQDRHIRKTQILAVNNNQIVDTQQRVSITKALLGGLIAGEAGFIIGGLSGSSTSIVRNGPNTYTFLVVYDDRPPVTETATEGSKRFQFLITKLEV